MITLTLISLSIIIFAAIVTSIITRSSSIIVTIGVILFLYAALKVITWFVSWIIIKVHEYKENENNNNQN